MAVKSRLGVKVNRERLKSTFMDLARIESPSRHEGEVAWYLKKVFGDELGLDVVEDASTGFTGSDTGNLVVHVPGKSNLSPVFFCAHMDTVGPTSEIKVLFHEKDGIFTSDGTTVLGADDKAACAILIEVVRCLNEMPSDHPPLDLVFTVCEEIGLLGAKALDIGLLRARKGYALDTTGTFNLINRAPCAVRFKVKVLGKSAHAGLNPEEGINAIALAASAITKAPLGRIDPDTTANIGIIHGGKATNIVPDQVVLEGEVRSHSRDRLKEVQDQILSGFHALTLTSKTTGPKVQIEVKDDYPLMAISDDHDLVVAAKQAALRLSRDLKVQKTGGGSDANIFCGKGLDTVILGIGMENVHSTEERISLDAMVDSAAFCLEIISACGGTVGDE